jgi:polysaccharide chain length determinant protein (PEP-CTERM system associated)
LNETLIKLFEDVRGSWRFRWVALSALAVVCVVGWIYVLLLPSVYEARARVYVDTQGALRPLLQGLTVTPNVESALAMVRQALLSQPHLTRVAHENGLDADLTTPRQRERLIASLQQRIVITANAGAAATDGLYTITFQDKSRSKSVAAVRSLLNAFVEDTLGNKRSGQQSAQRFLREQIAEYESRLSTAEQRLADFKKRNVGLMPDQRGDYFARLQTEVTSLEQGRRDLMIAQTRAEELRRQLSGEDPFVFGFDSELNSAAAGKGGGDLTARIQELEKREQELLLRFTDKHPEVIGLRDTLQELRAQQAAELERLHKGRGTGSLSGSTKANPVFQSMKLELNKAEVQVAELRRDVAQRSSNVESLRKLIDTVPQVEADIARLNRDYEVTRAEYLALVQRLETAKISQDADETGTVKFQVIDPPTVPLRPVAPNRPILFTAVLLFGLLIAGGSAFALDRTMPVFQNTRSLAQKTGLPVIGSVSRLGLESHAQLRRHDLWLFSGGTAAVLVVFIAVTVLGDQLLLLLSNLTGAG